MPPPWPSLTITVTHSNHVRLDLDRWLNRAAQHPTQQGNFHNDLLPDSVQQEIRKKLSDAEKRLASLEANVPSTTNSMIDQSNVEYSGLVLCINSYRTAIAPHRRLTDDVLQEIFLHCAPRHITAPHLSGSHTKPYTLMHVCSKWRQLVFQLWHEIFVRYKTRKDLWYNAVLVKDTILRYGSSPISLIIKVDDGRDHMLTASSPTNPITDLIVEIAGSLRYLTWIGSPNILDNFLRLPASSAEFLALERVCLADLGSSHTFESCMTKRHIQSFNLKNAHKLHTFALVTRAESLVLYRSPLLLDLPWNQMTHLQFTQHTMWCDEFFLLLNLCVNLSEFRGVVSGDVISEGGQVNEISSAVLVLPNLTLLWIDNDINPHHLFPRLDLPNLTSFQLRDKIGLYSAQDWVRIILPFLKRSNRLTHLRLEPLSSYQCISGRTLHSYLCDLPCLVSLSLRQGLPLLDPTLEAIASGELVPKLEMLECRVDAFTFVPFLHMLEQRCMSTNDGDTRFTRIWKVMVITRYRDIEQVEILDRVERLRAQGLCMEFEVFQPHVFSQSPLCQCCKL